MPDSNAKISTLVSNMTSEDIARQLSPRQVKRSISSRAIRRIESPRVLYVSSTTWNLHDKIAVGIRQHARKTALPDYGLVTGIIERQKFPVTPDQKDAITMMLSENLSCLFGPPGTGKSTTLSVTCQILRAANPGGKIMVASFAGRIADETAFKCKAEATTLHALTGLRPESGEHLVSKKTQISPDITTLIIDEAFSVPPVVLAAAILFSPPTTRIILAGDPEQALPIGEGRALHDAIRMGIIPLSKLTTSHRLAGSPHLTSQIQRVREGLEPRQGPGLKIITTSQTDRENNSSTKINLATSIYNRALQEGKRHAILTQTQKGDCGYKAINRHIARRNRPTVGDQIITTQPLWGKDANGKTGQIWKNGEMGEIIEQDEDRMSILFRDGRTEIVKGKSDLIEFTHAISGARAQGLEYDSVTIILDRYGFSLVNKQYLVSVLSRAPVCTVITPPGLLRQGAKRDGLQSRAAVLPCFT